ncbi:MAG: L-lactate dehydrogenase [Lachnospiraceae bacterium]|nr:L-lactate dehydrogenase [Lachnospiraceae bacterium]
MKKRIIAIIGVGHVGAHCAYSLMMQGLVDELLLVDNNEQKAASECQDLRDAVVYCPNHVDIRIANYNELQDCDIIVNCIGKITLLETHDRLTELNFTIAQINDYIPQVMAGGFHGIIINITNPCDIITRQIALLSGLPKGHVFGTGTGLDTSRLVSALSMQTGIDHKSISAYMMGEHGDKQMVPWSTVNFAGIPLSALEKKDPKFQFDKEELKKKSIGGGWVTYVGKGCTEYGICTTLARDVFLIQHDEKRIMPASFQLDGEYGEFGLFAGVPCIIGQNGVEQVLELPLTEAEMAEFHSCCEGLRHNMTLNATIL